MRERLNKFLIYNKTWVDNLYIHKKAHRWYKNNFISKDEYSNICTNYPTGYHVPSLFSRIGMFVFTTIIIISASALFSLLFSGIIEKSITGLCFLYGIAYFAGCEFFTREQKHFRSGITDALLYFAVSSLSIGVYLLLCNSYYTLAFDTVVYLFCILPILMLPAIRYADAFLSLSAYLCLFIINAILIMKMGSIGNAILPFEGMALSLLVYNLTRKQRSDYELRFWKKPLTIIEIASLVTFYSSGNYLVIRMLSEALLNATIAPGEDISLAFFFYAFTILVPLVYIWRGLNKKDYILIRLGIILEVVGILCIRHYHSIMPVETAMILSGIVLIIISWLSIKYLKSPRNGITYLQTDDQHDLAISAVSSILISEAAKGSQNTPGETSETFKGGSSGGGGAGGEF